VNDRRQLLTVAEFADALGVTKACVRRWLFERRINSTRVGRLVRIRFDEIDRIVQAGDRPAHPARPNALS
jgi:excisionase family DNA binding protein